MASPLSLSLPLPFHSLWQVRVGAGDVEAALAGLDETEEDEAEAFCGTRKESRPSWTGAEDDRDHDHDNEGSDMDSGAGEGAGTGLRRDSHRRGSALAMPGRHGHAASTRSSMRVRTYACICAPLVPPPSYVHPSCLPPSHPSHPLSHA